MARDVLSRLFGIRIRPACVAAIFTMTAEIALFLGVNAMGNWLGWWRGLYSWSPNTWNLIDVKSSPMTSWQSNIANRGLSHWIVMLPTHLLLI